MFIMIRKKNKNKKPEHLSSLSPVFGQKKVPLKWHTVSVILPTGVIGNYSVKSYTKWVFQSKTTGSSEREPPPAGRVRRPRLPPPPPRLPPPPGGRGSAPRRPLRALHPLLTTRRGGRLRRLLPLARRPPRAPCPRRAASGGARRSPTPLRAGGPLRPGTLGRAWGRGVPAREGASPTCGQPAPGRVAERGVRV